MAMRSVSHSSPKPNEPRANMYLATIGEVLYLISRLDKEIQPLFGANPETAHSRIAGLDYLWDVELCIEADKLFHIHLQMPRDGQRYDQDLPFGYTEPLKDLALLVVLQDAGYAGPICFDIKAPRTDEQKDITDIITVSSRNLVWLWDRALEVDREKIGQVPQGKPGHGALGLPGRVLIWLLTTARTPRSGYLNLNLNPLAIPEAVHVQVPVHVQV